MRAVALAAVWGLLFVLATPGFDAMPAHALESAGDRAKLEARLPRWVHPFAYGLVAFNREVRQPLAEALIPLQQPLRVRQDWSLYLDGPNECHRLEVDIDGVLVHRTKDAAYPWRAALLRAPPIRPIVDGVAGKPDGGANWRGLVRLVAQEAVKDDPDAQWVELRAMWGAFPACVTREHHAFVATAPTWEPRRK